jgi:hypothetical protein
MTLFQGSRYEDTPLLEPDDTARPLIRGLRARQPGPAHGVLEHRVIATDRLDTLAHRYHADSRSWYRLAEANPEVLFAEDMLPEPPDPRDADRESTEDSRLGRTILIPAKREA